MVQGEKQTGVFMTMANSGRTSDPSARKAGYEAVQSSFGGNNVRRDSNGGSQQQQSGGQSQNSYGSWGPIFQSKSHFSEMHLC